MNPKTTGELMHLLSSARNISELKQYTDTLSQTVFPSSFSEYLSELLRVRQIPPAELIAAAGIQRNYGYQILDGQTPSLTDKVLSICLALTLDVTETQRALTLTQNGQLYSKNKRDSILIFALEKKLSVIDTNVLLEEMGELILS